MISHHGIIIFTAILITSLESTSAQAHHDISEDLDLSNPVTIEGEIARMDDYDYVVVNHKLPEAVNQLCSVVKAVKAGLPISA